MVVDEVIFLPKTSKSPPSCGDVSDTKSVTKLSNDVLKAAISTPSTFPVTVIFPVTSRPPSASKFLIDLTLLLSKINKLATFVKS